MNTTQERLAVVDPQRDILFVDLSHIAHDLSSLWPLHRTLQGCQTLSKELQSTVGINAGDSLKHFEAVCDFFFKQKKFKPLKSKPTLEKYLLPYALLSRRGPVELLLPLFIGLNRHVHLNIQVAHYNKEIILKLIVEGKAHFFNFKNACQPLTSEDLIHLVNSGCDCSGSVSEHDVLTKYLLRIKKQSLRERSLLHLYKIQTYLMKYQPFALNHILDRARAAYAIGDVVKAAEDVSQYLTFSKDMMHNNRITRLISKLNNRTLRRFHLGRDD